MPLLPLSPGDRILGHDVELQATPFAGLSQDLTTQPWLVLNWWQPSHLKVTAV